MKKTLIGALLAVAVTGASAFDLTVNANRDTDAKRNGAGLSIGKTVDGISLALGVDRFEYRNGNVDLYSLTAGYEFVKVMGVGLGVQMGVAYNDSELGRSGWALQPGVTASLPLTKKTAIVADYRRQYGQNSIQYLDGNAVSLGLKVSF